MSELVIPEDLRFWHNSLCDDKETYFRAPVATVRELIERIARAEAALQEIHGFAIYGCGTKQKDVRGRQFSAIEELSRPWMRLGLCEQ